MATALSLAAVPSVSLAQNSNSVFSPLGTSRILASCDPNPISLITPNMDWDGFAERDLVVVSVRNGDAYLINEVGQSSLISDKVMTKIGAALFCAKGADVLLIGKDRGPKRQWRDTVPIKELFETIDAMPMRQYEMRKMKSQ